VKQVILKPTLYRFGTCKEFVDEFKLGRGDLVLTNKYIFDPYFGELGIDADVIYQEQYGAGEPTDLMVDEILAAAAKTDCKRIIAIGGGTIIDIAKVLAVSNGQNVDTLYNNMANLIKQRDLVIIPTTCGTGSEVTNLAIINRTLIGTKMGLVSEHMYPSSAVLIPELLNSLPFQVFATSSIDALVHAVESVLSPKATTYTKLFSNKAIEMIISGYREIAKHGQGARLPLLENFLIASNFAGIAFGTAGCAAVHALSYPLSGIYHVSHGESNYAMFTGVLKNYMEINNDGAIVEMNAHLAELLKCDGDVVYDELESLLNHILPKKALHEYGVTLDDMEVFTYSVMKTQGRLMANNFVELSKARVLKIYCELL
jgi:4-hydroxybutyrate dehydrogenase